MMERREIKDIDRNKNISIQRSKVVLCEGYEETMFFPRLLKLCNRPDLFESIQFLTYKGKNNLENFLTKELVKLPGYTSVYSLGVVMDSNGNPNGFERSVQKVQGALRFIGFPVPDIAGQTKNEGTLRSIMWILPDNGSIGEFEDLCMKALEKHPLFPCIEVFKKCAVARSQTLPQSAKAPLYTILAWNEPCGKRLGELSDDIIRQWNLETFRQLIDSFFAKV